MGRTRVRTSQREEDSYSCLLFFHLSLISDRSGYLQVYRCAACKPEYRDTQPTSAGARVEKAALPAHLWSSHKGVLHVLPVLPQMPFNFFTSSPMPVLPDSLVSMKHHLLCEATSGLEPFSALQGASGAGGFYIGVPQSRFKSTLSHLFSVQPRWVTLLLEAQFLLLD